MAHNAPRTHFGKVSNRAVMPTVWLSKKQEEMRRFLPGGTSLRWGTVRQNIKTTIWSWFHGTDG
ncbi:hypothetical protein M405DRAFT_830914 [Rhizopogon salebrosus TDB-379]|nr:hypothetical protein M405DRAFT_830914 [Rhizopogon salebrosus TDB-379]